MVFIDRRFCLLRADELPTRSLTLAPGSELNVTMTEEYLTGLPMSINRPEPVLRWPKPGVAYHCEVHAVRGLLSIAYFAYLLSSLPGSAFTLVNGSKPVAPAGFSIVTEVSGVLLPGVGWPGLPDPPPLGHSATAAATTAATSRPAATSTPVALLGRLLRLAGPRPWARRGRADRLSGRGDPPYPAWPSGGQSVSSRAAPPCGQALPPYPRPSGPRPSGPRPSGPRPSGPRAPGVLGALSRLAGTGASGSDTGGNVASRARERSPGLVSGPAESADGSCMARHVRSDSASGIPAMTWRGLRGTPPLTGAVGSDGYSPPGQ